LKARKKSPARIAALVLLTTVLAACGSVPVTSKPVPGADTRQIELSHVPFYPQVRYQCGPAALAMALDAAGLRVTPEDLVPEVYLPAREGSLQVEMLATARRHGTVAYRLDGGFDALYAEIDAGNPVIVLQNMALSWFPAWHYAVVIGYDGRAGAVILHSGTEARGLLPLSQFERTWKRSDEWAMLVLSPGRIPATATSDRYVQAVIALEKAGQLEPARVAYEAATRRWPDSLLAWMGLGNTSYALHDLGGAESAYREAAIRHPESAAAYNNLAQVLADRKRYPEAIAAARTAVSLGGPESDTARHTLETILAKTR
jgi:tetratricopeptide (TPR) repeat protein